MKHGIYWLVSYPKSGNTWMRAIISNYLANSDEPVDINNFQTDGICSNRHYFDELLSLPSSDMSEDEIKVYQPEVFKELSKNAKKNLYIKVHDAYTFNKENKAIFPKDITKGVLYIIRNPLDVVVSYSHHNSSEIEKTIKNLNNENFTIAKSKKSLSSQLPQQMLSWSGHINSWINSDLPIHIMRYEDMLNKPYETFSKALEFLGFEIDKNRLEKTIRFSSFEELKKQEEEKSFNEKPLNAKSFFRNGKVKGYENILTLDMIEEIKNNNYTLMKKFNYLD